VLLSDLLSLEIGRESNELGDLDHNLAKVEVASSTLVSRSKTSLVVNDLQRLLVFQRLATRPTWSSAPYLSTAASRLQGDEVVMTQHGLATCWAFVDRLPNPNSITALMPMVPRP